MADLLIVGPGRLGLLVAGLWRQQQQAGQTATSSVHLKFRSDNAERTKDMEQQGYTVLPAAADTLDRKFSHVVFCAPPTGNENYAADVDRAMQLLNSDGNGLFVFTSSGSVYAENSGGEIDENSPLARSPRSSKIIDAEEVVLAKGGCVMRLGGLYAADSGFHLYLAKGGEFPASADGLINFVHYEDAAAAVMAALLQPDTARGQVFLVSDGQLATRQDIAAAAQQSSLYRDKPAVVFTGGPGVDGKKYNTAKIRQALSWSPAHPSFVAFLQSL